MSAHKQGGSGKILNYFDISRGCRKDDTIRIIAFIFCAEIIKLENKEINKR